VADDDARDKAAVAAASGYRRTSGVLTVPNESFQSSRGT
jgi:hypothetical protein